MAAFVLRRALQAIVVVLSVITGLFVLLRLSGDPVTAMVGPNSTAQQIEQMRHSLGLDQPLPVQYATFIGDAIRLQFGSSIATHRDVMAMVEEVLPNTVILAFGALILGLLFAFPIGIYSSLHPQRAGSFLAMLGAILGVSVPAFWLGILLILLFAVRLHWLPSFGTAGPLNWIMPMLTLSVGIVARESRLIRAGMLDVLHHDYIRTAYMKGLAQRGVVIRHALKNALLPVIASLGIDLSHLIGGALIVEQVFAISGVGRQMFQAIGVRDYPVVQGTVFVIAVWVVIINFVVDVVYGYVDPRISTEALH